MKIKVGDIVKVTQDLYEGDDSLAAYDIPIGSVGVVSSILTGRDLCPVRVKFNSLGKECDLEFDELVLEEVRDDN